MDNNQKIPWDDAYLIGITKVDKQHKKLFELVNKLYDLEEGEGSKEKLRELLYDFSDYVKVHFKEEEEYMNAIGFPDLKRHRAIHNSLVETLYKIIQTPAKLDIIKTKMRVIAKRVLVDHIIQEDTKIKEYVVENHIEEIFDISIVD